MKGSKNESDSLYYKFHKISLNLGGSYTDSPKWLKNEKATINPRNNDDKCFQFAVVVILNYQNIKNNPENISKLSHLLINISRNK